MTQQTIPVTTAPAWPASGDPTRRPRILALDLSLRSTGLAWTDHTGQIGVATIHPAGTGHARLNDILIEVMRHTRGGSLGPQLAVIEQLFVYPGREGAALELAGLYWLVRHRLWLSRIPYVLVNPDHPKMYACGRGRGVDKTEVTVAMQRLYYDHGPRISNSDEADAAALLALALDAYGAPLAVAPDTHRRAIRAVRWPALDALPGGVTQTPPPDEADRKRSDQ